MLNKTCWKNKTDMQNTKEKGFFFYNILQNCVKGQ